eukprot:s2742_g8.t1
MQKLGLWPNCYTGALWSFIGRRARKPLDITTPYGTAGTGQRFRFSRNDALALQCSCWITLSQLGQARRGSCWIVVLHHCGRIISGQQLAPLLWLSGSGRSRVQALRCQKQ